MGSNSRSASATRLSGSNLKLNLPQPGSMSQSLYAKHASKTPTSEHPPSVNLNRANRKFSRSQSCLNEQDILRIERDLCETVSCQTTLTKNPII